MTILESPSRQLPADLLSAELESQNALLRALDFNNHRFWALTLRFDTLKLLPISVRLCKRLIRSEVSVKLLWPDAGAAALARRDAPDLSNHILDFNQLKLSDNVSADLLLVISPQPSDYNEFLALCEAHKGKIVMLNGKLEDTSVGIGSVARERRRSFINSWIYAYWLQPLDAGAIMRTFPDGWRIFRRDPDGFREVIAIEKRPDSEMLAKYLEIESLNPIKTKVDRVDRFLDGLRN